MADDKWSTWLDWPKKIGWQTWKSLRKKAVQIWVHRSMGILRWLSGKESYYQNKRGKRCGFDPFVPYLAGEEDHLEWEMATHFIILAWKSPWTEELGRLQSIGLQRVGHNWMTEHVHTHRHTHTHTHRPTDHQRI